MNAEEVQAGHAEFLFPCVQHLYAKPLVIKKASGVTVTDQDGRDYLDMFGGILTVSLGHCHPKVVEAVSRQLQTLGHISTLYQNQELIKASRQLAELTPGRLKKCFWTNSGTEADETAVLLARIFTGRQEIIALRHGYSGRSLLATNLTAHGRYRLLPSQVPGIKHAPAPYCYRCPFGLSYPGCNLKCAHDLDELIQTTTCGQPAAFLAEPILGVGGFIVPPREYFQIAVGIVRKYGGIFICDEVQTGFGRTGEHWFGIEHYGIDPEIMTFAKGIANGFPVGATIATPEVADAWTGPSISTFGGNPVSMVAVQATLETMQNENMPTRSQQLGVHLRKGLEELQACYDWIGDVRGMGLMQALELVEDRVGKTPAHLKTNGLLEAARVQGLLLGKGGLHGNIIRIAPPMTISKADLDEALLRLQRACEAVK